MNPDPSSIFSTPVLDSAVLVRTERLRIGVLQSELLASYCEIVCDPSTGLYDEEFPKSSEEALQSLQESVATEPFTVEEWNEYGVFAESTLVGVISHRDFPADDGRMRSRVGYHFNAGFQGRGFATEAVRGLVQTLCENGINEIECVVHPDNIPSLALLRRLGFAQVGFDADANEVVFQYTISDETRR